MESENFELPDSITFSPEEMVIGRFSEHSIDISEVWAYALKAQGRVISGSHLIQGVKTDIPGEQTVINPRRIDMLKKAAVLAGRLIPIAVARESMVLMTDIEREFSSIDLAVQQDTVELMHDIEAQLGIGVMDD